MIDVKNLTVFYNEVLALNNISTTIEASKITGIIGPNGSGKSTFLKAMLGIIPHQEGAVFLGKENIKNQLNKIAYVEQKSNVDVTFPITVRELVSMGLYANLGFFQGIRRDDWDNVNDALYKVNLSNYKNRQIMTLSGGQFQRALLARCLVQKSEIIFLDEPFAGIDSLSEKIIVDILKNLKKEGKTILIIHHDLNKVREYFDNLILLKNVLIAHGDVPTVFNKNNLFELYGDTIFIEKEVGNDSKFY